MQKKYQEALYIQDVLGQIFRLFDQINFNL